MSQLLILPLLLANCATAFSPKRGLSEAACCSSDVYCGDLAAAPFSWSYSWGLAPAARCPGAPAHFEPMFWGAKSIANDSSLFTGSATHLLGFNEPNGKDQSNLTPQQAAALWPTVSNAAQAYGLKLVAPVPSGDDTAWLDAFFAACGCEADVDVVALHPYVCTVAGLDKALATWFKYKKPLWVTEFNCGDGVRNASAAEHLAYMKVALPFLDNDPRVLRYAWMSGRDKKVPGAALFDGAGGQLTELGRLYVT
jgi:hypothetical protein